MSFEQPSFPAEEVPEEYAIDIEDIDDARAIIEDFIERGEYPVVTVPREYETAISAGLHPHTTWMPDVRIITETLGIEPYTRKEEERVAFKVHVDADAVEPRFSGPDSHWHGVVVFRGPIKPEYLEKIPL